MRNIYFYYDNEDWNELCLYLKSLNLDLYMYDGEKMCFQTLFSRSMDGNWFVLVPQASESSICRNGIKPEFSNAVYFYNNKYCGKILPAVFSCNDKDKISISLFNKIKNFLSSNYLKTDNGKEYISKQCYDHWLNYEVSLASLPKFIAIESNPEHFSFDIFLEYFSKKGYVFFDPCLQDFDKPISSKTKSCIITIPELIVNKRVLTYSDGISVSKKKKNGKAVYRFIMDYRFFYHRREKIIALFEEIKKYCNLE